LAVTAKVDMQMIAMQVVRLRPEHGGEMRASRVMRETDDAAALLDGSGPRRLDRNRASVLEREADHVERIAEGVEAEVAVLGIVDAAAGVVGAYVDCLDACLLRCRQPAIDI